MNGTVRQAGVWLSLAAILFVSAGLPALHPLLHNHGQRDGSILCAEQSANSLLKAEAAPSFCIVCKFWAGFHTAGHANPVFLAAGDVVHVVASPSVFHLPDRWYGPPLGSRAPPAVLTF